MKFLLASLLSLVLVAAVGQAAAQVTFYEHDDFRGRSFTVDRPVSDFMRYGFNDRASSVSVRSGSWQLCTDADFHGRCVTLSPGDYRSLEAMGLNDRVSSVRVVGGGPEMPPGAPPAPVRGRIQLFDNGGFGGRAVTLDNDVMNFAQIGFNDRANSAVVEGGTWQLCEHESYQGSCMTLQPGRYPDLGQLAGRVSSARLIAGGPPPRSSEELAGRAILYARPEFQGRPLVLDQPIVRDLVNWNFNDRAASLRVESGYWMFCSDANFEGECRTFGPGDYPVLPSELHNSISSGRRISNRYPYRDAPNWRGH